MAVYLSREKMVEEGFTVEPVIVCVSKIKSRLLTDFNFQQNNCRSDHLEPDPFQKEGLA